MMHGFSSSAPGNPHRYKSKDVIRTTKDSTPFEDTHGPPRERIETAPQKRLKQLLQAQLDNTKEGSHLEFVGTQHIQTANHKGGLQTLQQFRAREKQVEERPNKKPRIAHPDFLKQEEEERNRKQEEQEQAKERKQPMMSRHEREIERSLLVGKNIPLAHLFMDEDLKQEEQLAEKANKEPLSVESKSEVERSSTENGVKQVIVQEHVAPIPEEDIKKNKATLEEIRALPHFKNYQPGAPTKILYIKNLPKRVKEHDLIALFGRFQQPGKDKISFKLISRGQAFITFPDAVTATAAFELVCGYRLKNRPMVIEYGKNG